MSDRSGHDEIDAHSVGLGELLDQARLAEPTGRITYRDPIAAHGEAAIEAMTDWIGDPRLAAFAIRVLGEIGKGANTRHEVVAVLRAVDRTGLQPHIIRDLDQALASLDPPTNASRRAPRSRSGGSPTRTARPGVRGRGYWVMRTSPWERPFLWDEAQQGRLRQGWGTHDDQDLEVIATAVKRGSPLSDDQREARRALRMLTTWEQGMRVGDLIAAPHLPDYGRLSVFRLVGSYRWERVPARRFGERFGHVLPVELVLGDVDRWGNDVSDGLRAVLRPQPRLFNISGSGGELEQLIGGEVGPDHWGEPWTEDEYDTLFGRFPPDGDRPSAGEIEVLALEFGRTEDAIGWQWGDGATYWTGGSASTTSDPLKAWLDRRRRSP